MALQIALRFLLFSYLVETLAVAFYFYLLWRRLGHFVLVCFHFISFQICLLSNWLYKTTGLVLRSIFSLNPKNDLSIALIDLTFFFVFIPIPYLFAVLKTINYDIYPISYDN